jgi:thioredoxin reductase
MQGVGHPGRGGIGLFQTVQILGRQRGDDRRQRLRLEPFQPLAVLGAQYLQRVLQLGGQITAMYPEKSIHDGAGFPAVRGRDLVDGLVEQAGRFSPTYLLGETVTDLSYDDGRPALGTRGGRTVRAGAVVITGGIGTFTPRPLPAGERFLGRSLEHFVPRPEYYAGRDVVIVGGGDSALDWARTLRPVARSVVLVHRRERFRAHRYAVEEVRRSSVRLLTSCDVVAVHGNGHVEPVEVMHRPTESLETLPDQAVVAALGFIADLGPLKGWDLAIKARRIVVSSSMATSLPKVYAAGDIVAYPGKVRLIAVGFGEVATAVNNAAVEIDPSLDLLPGHSTDVF